MSGITVKQYVVQLQQWNQAIQKKERVLSLGYRVYKMLQFGQLACTTMAAAIITFLSSLALGLTESSVNSSYIINSIILALSLWIIFWNAADNVFKFGITASSASTSAKQYSQLYHELEVEIASALNSEADIVTYENYKNKLLYYSSREQLILQVEPGLIFIGYSGNRSIFEGKYITTVLSPDDLEEVATFLESIDESPQKQKMMGMLTKVYEAYHEVIDDSV